MSNNNHDTSGIDSLRGFSFQIKVFVWQLLKITDNQIVEFETLEDVNIQEFTSDILDEHEDKISTKIIDSEKGTNTAIQVKHTKITKRSARQILLNWLYIEINNDNVKEYILVTAPKYKNKKEVIEELDLDTLYQEIIGTDKGKASLIWEVKEALNGEKQLYETKINQVIEKYKFNEIDIDVEIIRAGNKLFVRQYDKDFLFMTRLKRFSQEITSRVLESVDKREAFKIEFKDTRTIVEQVCNDIKEDEYQPYITDWKARNYQDRMTDIVQMREYIQLSHCKLKEDRILKHLNYMDNYKDARYDYITLNDKKIIEGIENLSYDNYEDVREDLLDEVSDTPGKRLSKTKNKTNSFAVNEVIKYGSLIFLTKEDEIEKQISWKDDKDG